MDIELELVIRVFMLHDGSFIAIAYKEGEELKQTLPAENKQKALKDLTDWIKKNV